MISMTTVTTVTADTDTTVTMVVTVTSVLYCRAPHVTVEADAEEAASAIKYCVS